MDNEHKFWFVWNEKRMAPAYKHQSQDSAKREAERLARMNRGETFIVLESIGQVVVDDVKWIDHSESMPF